MAERKESHAHRGRCAGSRTARDMDELFMFHIRVTEKAVPLFRSGQFGLFGSGGFGFLSRFGILPGFSFHLRLSFRFRLGSFRLDLLAFGGRAGIGIVLEGPVGLGVLREFDRLVINQQLEKRILADRFRSVDEEAQVFLGDAEEKVVALIVEVGADSGEYQHGKNSGNSD